MLGDLEKVGWAVLKSSFNVNPYCDLENILYELNNDDSKKRLTGFQLMENNIKCVTNKTNTLMKLGSLLVIL